MPPKKPTPPQPPAVPPTSPDDELTPTGGHLILPGGRIIPVEVGEVDPPDGSTSSIPPWVRSILIPLVGAAVTAFLTAGGVIQLGRPAAAENAAEAATENAALREALRQLSDLNDAQELRIRALELQAVELSTTLRIHIAKEPPP